MNIIGDTLDRQNLGCYTQALWFGHVLCPSLDRRPQAQLSHLFAALLAARCLSVHFIDDLKWRCPIQTPYKKSPATTPFSGYALYQFQTQRLFIHTTRLSPSIRDEGKQHCGPMFVHQNANRVVVMDRLVGKHSMFLLWSGVWRRTGPLCRQTDLCDLRGILSQRLTPQRIQR